MATSETFEEQVQEALNRLHDPGFEPSDQLYQAAGCPPQSGPIPLQSSILQQIRALEPDRNAPDHDRRVYEILRRRYVERLTQEQTAALMNLSVRHLNRLQKEAVHALALRLWEHGHPQGQSPESDTKREVASQEAGVRHQASDWDTQVERELALLEASSPDTVSDVGEAIKRVLRLEHALVPDSVAIEVAYLQPGLAMRVHPSVLDQVLITAMRRLSSRAQPGPVRIFAGMKDGDAEITLTGLLNGTDPPKESDLLRDVLVPRGASISVDVDGDRAFLHFRMPTVDKVAVLAVDDNPDMLHFYRRSLAGTRYSITHVAQGRRVFEMVESMAPDLIILDVMLPDMDGWQLLMRLHEDPTTRSIPIIVCTVIREKELAMSLGAAAYLPKPVRPRQLTRALDQLLARA
jgi:CheY-like chemotaxis protein